MISRGGGGEAEMRGRQEEGRGVRKKKNTVGREGGSDRKGGRKRIREEKRMKGVSRNEGKQKRYTK